MARYIEARRRFDKDPYEILAQVQYLTSKEKFRDFVEVPQPYRYFGCETGAEREPEYKMFPNAMKILSRTNLSLKNPTADGKMVFKKNDFHSELAKLFE